MLGKEWTVVKVPYGGGYCSLNIAKPKNTKTAPNALQKEFERLKIFTADNGELINDLKWYEMDINFRHQNTRKNWAKIDDDLSFKLRNLFSISLQKLLFVGGSHTITYLTFKAMSDVLVVQSGLVVLDAHPDCCKKADWPIHSDWLRCLIERRLILPENILSFSKVIFIA